MMGNKQLEKIVCGACNETFLDHSKRQLIRCLFRVQSTMITDEMSRLKAKRLDEEEDTGFPPVDKEDVAKTQTKSWQQKAYEVQG